MAAIERGQQFTNVDTDHLERMIGPDEHRPGPARARLVAEQIPVWAIIGHLQAVEGTTDLAAVTDEAIARAAADYDVTIEAVHAALHYYHEHRGAIDALLAANEAALA